ncbi:hypothetical protein Pmani_032588 [Petrolisthes manimaculis]|uniref:Uncharacterized protein n=1 Tax=Petrolisthes manimaculis TaxID=1843537 RepID=A0AAE1NTJ2_9EUCA|nr:hypothetical protein Pmani_032588 [Petrolisthes manimaculis]
MDIDQVFDLISMDHLQPAITNIKKDLPQSACIFNNIFLHSKGLSYRYNFFKPGNAHSNSHIFLYTPKLGKCYSQQSELGIYCKESEATVVHKLLAETNLIDWEKDFCIFPLPEYLEKAVDDMYRRQVPGESLNKRKSDVFTYSANVKPLVCPKGVKLCKLGKRGVEVMVNEYRYKHSVNVETLRLYLRQVPNVGVYPDSLATQPREITTDDIGVAGDEEEPLAWVCL